MDVHFYKGYKIHAVPCQLADTGEWQTKLFISREFENKIGIRNFYNLKCFQTREKANAHCLKVGMDIIEGKIGNCTVNGL